MIFASGNIGSLSLKNKFIKTFGGDFSAEPNGYCSESYSQYLEQFARGGVALICTAPAAIQSNFRINRYQLSISSREAAHSYKSLIKRIHTYGARVFLYPDYANQVIVKFICSVIEPESSRRRDAFKGMQRWITSLLKGGEITEIISLYKEAIMRGKETGFDGIFLNVSFGSFLQTTSSSVFNQRQDEWGGDLKKRLKILKEILTVCKALDFPVIVRWNLKDYGPGGLTMQESIEACQLLQAYGADALELVAFISIESTIALNKDIERRESLPLTETTDLVDYYRLMHPLVQNSFFLKRQKDIKLPMEYVWGHAYFNIQPITKILKIPVSLVGGVRSLKTAEKILDSGIADFISLSRVLIHNPAQCRDFEEGASLYSSCISCNCCTNEMLLSIKDPSRPYLHQCVTRGDK
jgi:2,4-dienoyl-CoA reductase-like NADH-dependent reductase (Old Yellow Enzyme family)